MEESSAAENSHGHDMEVSDLKVPAPKQVESGNMTLIAKFGKQRLELASLSENTTIGAVKSMLQERTRVLPKRQKLVGLVAIEGGARGVTDDLPLAGLKVKGKAKQDGHITHQFILMGTPEEEIITDIPECTDIVDDFDLEFNAGTREWLQHVATGRNLKKFTAETSIQIMNPPRPNLPLLVLDLDHTLLCFDSKSLQRAGISDNSTAQAMKRPHMDEFLTQTYNHYDLVVWSQTSWRWLETKLIELGMLTNPGYKICFVLDKSSMFTIETAQKNNSHRRHHVKPLQIIWTKFPRWNATNTVHLDDLKRNFALNPDNGLRCTGFYRKRSSSRRDNELLGLGRYLVQLAQSKVDFQKVNFDLWQDVVTGNRPLLTHDEDEEDAEQKPPASTK